MKRSKYEHVSFTKAIYYQGVLERLRNEVGSYLDFVEKRNSDHDVHKVGFWGGIRLLMPVIVSVAKANNETPQVFLRHHLRILVPFLVWEMFRNSLTHNDLMQYVKYQYRTIGWGITISGREHTFASDLVHIDVRRLYNDLKTFLEKEILKDDQTEFKVRIGLLYEHPEQEIVDELSRLK